MTVTLTEAQRSLGLFAESLAGQVVRIEALEPDVQGWPWDLALPEPLVVRLAPAMDQGATTDLRRRIYRMQVLQQLALVEFGTFGNDHEHLDPTAASTHPTIIESTHRESAAMLVILLEQLRVSESIRRSYPGAVADLDRILALARRQPSDDSPDARSDRGLIGALRRCCIGASPTELLEHCTAIEPWVIEQLIELLEPLRSTDATLDRSAAIAVAIAGLLHEHADRPRPTDGEPFTPTVDDAEDVEPEREPRDVDGMSTSPPPLDAEADRTGDDLEGSLQSSPISFAAEMEELEKSTSVQPRRPPTLARSGIDPDDRTFMYDEWNYLDRSYQRSWCRLVERRLIGDDHDFIDDVRQRHALLRRQIRRQFAMLRPEERVRLYRRDDGDELDLDAVIEAIVDRRSGVAADDRLNIRRERATREVATAFLVDLSASTSSPAEEVESPIIDDDDDPFDDPFTPRPPVYDETPIRRVIDVAKDAVALMCDALGQLGDRHAVYGFSGQGRHEVEFRVGKEFDDRSTPTTWAALGAMAPLSYTRMGPAIRHAATKLAAQDARTKLLIVISDGYPQDIDYGPDRRDKDYGLHDTARAIDEAAHLGVDTFCVTIDPAGHDYLRVMSPEHRYLVIDDVESLPAELAKLYLDLAAVTSTTASSR